ncbi:MAG: OprD family outer membrane porin [Pseudomonadota bacterium]|nr:OprD family outer membrane porin [Pseudomonadota bacterium]
MKPSLLKILTAITLGLAFLAKSASSSEPEYLTYDAPVSDSVEEIEDAFGRTVPKGREPEAAPEPAPPRPWWRDGSLDLHLRSYYLEQDREKSDDRLAWALGGWLGYQTGWWRDRISVGATLYTSQKLYGPDHKDGTLLLAPDQRSFSVLGQAFVDARVTDQAHLRLFRQTFDLPYVNKRDNRMVPNTFEAYTLLDLEDPKLNYIVGHITKIKERNASQFEYMSEAAGAPGTRKGLSMAGFRYAFTPSITAGAINYYSWDVMNIFYTEAVGAWTPNDGFGLRLSGQYTDQRSVGDDLIGSFSTSVFGLKAAGDYRNAILSLAYTSTANDSGIRSPFGGYPGYISLIVQDFDRAGEDAWLLGLSYDFAGIGAKGLSGFVNYANGDTPDNGRNASPDQEELDITLDYKPELGALKGLWFRARAAFVDQQGAGAQDIADYRFILNYEIPLL